MKNRRHFPHNSAPEFGRGEVLRFRRSTDQYGRHRGQKGTRGRELGDVSLPLAGVSPGKSAFRVNAHKPPIHDPSCSSFRPLLLFVSSLTFT
jgi:hypothetical protein